MEDVLTKICSVRPPLRLCAIHKTEDATCGFHLSRTQWDPYPWISNVDTESPAAAAGLTIGDFVIEVNGEDILGLKIDEVAKKVRLKNDAVRLLVWKSTLTETENKLPAAFNLQKFSGFLQSTLQLLECPVCMDVVASPTYQCVNGHLLCINCRQKTSKCPMCRVTLSAKGRCLLAEKLHRLIRKTLAVNTINENCDNSVGSKVSNKTVEPLKINSEINTNAFYNCPLSDQCNQRFFGEAAVFSHLYKCHNGPFTQYILRSNSLQVSIPKNGGLAFVTTPHDVIFFLRLLETRQCWLSVLGETSKARQYSFKIFVGNETEDVQWCAVSLLSETVSQTLSLGNFFIVPQSVTDVRIEIKSI